MKEFMNEDFLLENDFAKKLYHDYAEKMPIIDYHCHVPAKEIAENKQFSNISEIWLGGDHYKWRAMRCNGIPESQITDAIKDNRPFDIFMAWAKTLPRLIGNPLYHWTYLELKRYFGITEQLTPQTAKKIYDECNKKLSCKDMSVKKLIEQSNVDIVCTTDDPLDDLKYHKIIAEDKSFKTKVYPSFRPDKAINIDADGFSKYIKDLGKVCNININTFDDLKTALYNRVDFFIKNGCRSADHALTDAYYETADKNELNIILQKSLQNKNLTLKECEIYKTSVLQILAEKYYKEKLVMQLHMSSLRNNSQKMFQKLGPDTGYDCAANSINADKLIKLLNSFEEKGMPRIVLYSLNANDNEILNSISGSFQTDSEFPNRIQVGASWWFNDHKDGITKQLISFANLSCLSNFIGMLTDSRSFLSYTRHEYFRRILCNLIGSWAENGEIFADEKFLGSIVNDICYNNTKNFFNF